MKALLSGFILLAMWSLAVPVWGGSNQVDLTGKGTSNLDQSGKDALATSRQVHDMHRAQQGKKAMDDLENQQRQNQADMRKSWDEMNKGSNLPNPWKEPKPETSQPPENKSEPKSLNSKPLHRKPQQFKSMHSKKKKTPGRKGKSWQVSHR